MTLPIVYRGHIAEHITRQELLARSASVMNKLHFWVREKKQSSAEVDYIFQYNGKLIPLEIKSGAIGKLRLLHQLMDQTPHSFAIRVWQGELVQNANSNQHQIPDFQVLYHSHSLIIQHNFWI